MISTPDWIRDIQRRSNPARKKNPWELSIFVLPRSDPSKVKLLYQTPYSWLEIRMVTKITERDICGLKYSMRMWFFQPSPALISLNHPWSDQPWSNQPWSALFSLVQPCSALFSLDQPCSPLFSLTQPCPGLPNLVPPFSALLSLAQPYPALTKLAQPCHQNMHY